MFFRTLLFGIAGAIGGAIAAGLVPWLAGAPSWEAIYWFWMCAVGFASLSFANIVNEYLGLYKKDPWGRFFGRKRD